MEPNQCIRNTLLRRALHHFVGTATRRLNGSLFLYISGLITVQHLLLSRVALRDLCDAILDRCRGNRTNIYRLLSLYGRYITGGHRSAVTTNSRDGGMDILADMNGARVEPPHRNRADFVEAPRHGDGPVAHTFCRYLGGAVRFLGAACGT